MIQNEDDESIAKPTSKSSTLKSTAKTSTAKPTTKPSPVNSATLSLNDIQIDAFRPSTVKKTEFQEASPCALHPSNLIPIIVGCTLAALVVVVLVAYLVGRKWKSNREYSQME